MDVEWYGHNSMGTIYADVTHTTKYYEYELDFDTVYDYWTRLEHQYAGMAMQGLLANHYITDRIDISVLITEAASTFAKSLVEKMKEKK